MSPIKLIIFDFDGVLREVSWTIIFEAYQKLIEFMGKKPEQFFTDVSSFREWNDSDWHKNEARIQGGKYVPNREFNKVFHSFHDVRSKLYPWASDVFEHLSKNYKLAIQSSSTRESVEAELGELSRYFSFIVGGEDIANLKPDPEGILRILKENVVSKNEAIMIGDMRGDFFAGKSAGIKTGLVKWGLGDWDELRSLGADILFERPEDLLLKL